MNDRTLAQPLALVTVTHESAAELDGLLSSIARYMPDAELVVVDCASADGSAGVARAAGAATIALDRNVGFGAACNLGLAQVSAPATLLVNPDVELLDDSPLELAAELLRSDRLLAPLVLYPDGSRQDTVHPIPASAPDLVRAVLPAALTPGRARVALAPWQAKAPRRVGWAVGCAIAARTATLRRLGPFDESIFLYGEDLELCLRAAAGGVETWFWPAARVRHLGAHSSSKEFGGEPFELKAAARHDAVARRLGPGRARLDDASQAVTFGSRLLAKRALRRSAEREREQLRALLRRGPR